MAFPISAESRRRWAAGGAVAAGHLALMAALLTAHVTPVVVADEPEPIPVILATLPPPEPPPPKIQPDPKPSPAPPAKKPPPKLKARPTPPVAQAEYRPVSKGKVSDGVSEVSDAELSGAATAGSGHAGRPCDMVARLQAALRKDHRVQQAVAEARESGSALGKALRVWNGDWVRSNGQDGNGLAAVREAILWEVGFAPEACRAEPVRGLVLISLNDGPSPSRLVVGSGDWRWSDLLKVRRQY